MYYSFDKSNGSSGVLARLREWVRSDGWDEGRTEEARKMGASKEKKSAIVSGAGFAATLWIAFDKAVREAGGSDEDIHRLGTEEGEETLGKMARVAVLRGECEIVASGAAEASATDYFVPLSDPDAIREFMRFYTADKTEQMGKAWRRLATSLNYTGPVCWQVKAGFTLKRHAPKAGPCYQGFQHLQDWNFPDEPTKDGIVFWIPRLLEGSTGKNKDEQMALLADTRRRYELPDNHLASYGSVALLAGLILAHFNATGERMPLNQLWIRTDTRDADGNRLDLGNFDGDGLSCDSWDWDVSRDGSLGCFPLGVEP